MFQVRWERTALDDFSLTWQQDDARSRETINTAAKEIERMLGLDPWANSESRNENDRVLFFAPLGALFRIDPGARTVAILHVWRFHSPPLREVEP